MVAVIIMPTVENWKEQKSVRKKVSNNFPSRREKLLKLLLTLASHLFPICSLSSQRSGIPYKLYAFCFGFGFVNLAY